MENLKKCLDTFKAENAPGLDVLFEFARKEGWWLRRCLISCESSIKAAIPPRRLSSFPQDHHNYSVHNRRRLPKKRNKSMQYDTAWGAMIQLQGKKTALEMRLWQFLMLCFYFLILTSSTLFYTNTLTFVFYTYYTIDLKFENHSWKYVGRL